MHHIRPKLSCAKYYYCHSILYTGTYAIRRQRLEMRKIVGNSHPTAGRSCLNSANNNIVLQPTICFSNSPDDDGGDYKPIASNFWWSTKRHTGNFTMCVYYIMRILIKWPSERQQTKFFSLTHAQHRNICVRHNCHCIVSLSDSKVNIIDVYYQTRGQ
jgi:hypothetical protein